MLLLLFFGVLQVIELLMTCTLYLVVSTSLLSDSLSGTALPRLMCSLLSLMFLLPCLLLTDLRPVSTLSLLCSLAHVLIRWWQHTATMKRAIMVLVKCACAASWSIPAAVRTPTPEPSLQSSLVLSCHHLAAAAGQASSSDMMHAVVAHPLIHSSRHMLSILLSVSNLFHIFQNKKRFTTG